MRARTRAAPGLPGATERSPPGAQVLLRAAGHTWSRCEAPCCSLPSSRSSPTERTKSPEKRWKRHDVVEIFPLKGCSDTSTRDILGHVSKSGLWLVIYRARTPAHTHALISCPELRGLRPPPSVEPRAATRRWPSPTNPCLFTQKRGSCSGSSSMRPLEALQTPGAPPPPPQAGATGLPPALTAQS